MSEINPRIFSPIFKNLSFSKNANNSESEVVQFQLEVAAMADIILQGWDISHCFIHSFFAVSTWGDAEILRLLQCFPARQSLPPTPQLEC